MHVRSNLNGFDQTTENNRIRDDLSGLGVIVGAVGHGILGADGSKVGFVDMIGSIAAIVLLTWYVLDEAWQRS